MRRRSAQSGQAVSLFPFLAVLVCAMGSLILLLLIITRNVHPRYEQQEARQDSEESPTVSRMLAEPLDEKSVNWSDGDRFASTEIGSARWTRNQDVIDASSITSDAPAYVAEQHADAATRKLMKKKAELKQRRQEEQMVFRQLESTKAEKRADREEVVASLASLEKKLDELQRTNSHQQEELRMTQEAVTAKEDANRALRQAKERLQQKVEEAKTERDDRDGRLQIVAYDGQSGEERKPIFIECRKGVVRVHPDVGEMATEDLTSYSPRKNPLALALKAYARERGVGSPYALMVVRPDGIDEFYAVGQLLKANDIELGYELVTDGQEFDYGEVDRTARRKFEETLLAAREARPKVERMPEMDKRRGPGGVPSRGMVQRQALDDILGSISRGIEERKEGKSSSSRRTMGGGGDGRQRPSAAGRPMPEEGLRETPSSERFPVAARENGASSEAPQKNGSPPPGDAASRTMSPPQSATSATKQTQKKQQRTPFDSSSQGSSQGAPVFPSIGMERTIEIEVDQTGFSVEGRSRREVTVYGAQQLTKTMLQQEIQQEMSMWDEPPSGMRWAPRIEYQILPGGNRLAIRLESLSEELGYSTEVDYRLSDQMDGLFR